MVLSSTYLFVLSSTYLFMLILSVNSSYTNFNFVCNISLSSIVMKVIELIHLYFATVIILTYTLRSILILLICYSTDILLKLCSFFVFKCSILLSWIFLVLILKLSIIIFSFVSSFVFFCPIWIKHFEDNWIFH